MRNWCSYTHAVLEKVGLGDCWHTPENLGPSLNDWKILVKEKVTRWASVNWQSELARNRVLSTYAQIKHKLEWEPYLNENSDPAGRICLTN